MKESEFLRFIKLMQRVLQAWMFDLFDSLSSVGTVGVR